MALFTKPIPRQAFFAAALGALYSFLLLPTPLFWAAIGWLLLAVSLLFLRRLSYHAYSIWGLLWVAFRAVNDYRAGEGPATWALDVGVPAASVILLVTSKYLHYCDLAEGVENESE